MARIKGSKNEKSTEIDGVLLDKIGLLAGNGLTNLQIGYIVGIPKTTFERLMKEDPRIESAMELGRARVIDAVSLTAYQLAVSGKHPGMTQFYLKCRAGWAEKTDINVSGKTIVEFITKIGGDGQIKTVDNVKDEINSGDLEFDAEVVNDASQT